MRDLPCNWLNGAPVTRLGVGGTFGQGDATDASSLAHRSNVLDRSRERRSRLLRAAKRAAWSPIDYAGVARSLSCGHLRAPTPPPSSDPGCCVRSEERR